MIIGQASGVAAAMAIKGNSAVQEIDTAALTASLKELGVIMQLDGRTQSEILAGFSRRMKR